MSAAELVRAVERYLDRCVWDGDCLVLPGFDRYGEVSWGPRSARRRTTAHRAVFAVTSGHPSPDQVVRHRCDNPPCCNPAHLETGSTAENVRDAYERSRRDGSKPGVGGEANPAAVLTDALVGTLRRDVLSGISIRQAAKNRGLNYTAVRHAVRGDSWKHVTEPPPVRDGMRAGHPHPLRTPDDVAARAADMSRDGLSLAEIGDELGLNRVTVHYVLGRMGLTNKVAS